MKNVWAALSTHTRLVEEDTPTPTVRTRKSILSGGTSEWFNTDNAWFDTDSDRKEGPPEGIFEWFDPHITENDRKYCVHCFKSYNLEDQEAVTVLRESNSNKI